MESSLYAAEQGDHKMTHGTPSISAAPGAALTARLHRRPIG